MTTATCRSFDEEWELAKAAALENERELANRPKPPKQYWYGTWRNGSRVQTFLVKSEDKIPKDPLELRGPIADHNEAQRRANAMLGPKLVAAIPPHELEVQEGSVVVHSDTSGNHYAVVLRVRDNSLTPCLFFTSSARFGQRRASMAELALAGYRMTKTTYLASCVRDVRDMTPTGLSFSKENTDALYEEFFEED